VPNDKGIASGQGGRIDLMHIEPTSGASFIHALIVKETLE